MWLLSYPVHRLCAEAHQLREPAPSETKDRSNDIDSSLIAMTPRTPLSCNSLYRDELFNPDDDIIQFSDSLIEQIIYHYKREVSRHWIVERRCVPVSWANIQITLYCRLLPPNIQMELIRWQGTKYQYDLRSKAHKLGLGSVAKRPDCRRIPFLRHSSYSDPRMTVSHLCHFSDCYNWRHHALQTLEVNKSINGCPGLSHCFHKVKCIRPGPYSSE
jgi:hypothetical protein